MANIIDTVLANLRPFGRSRLYSEKMAQDLSNNVNNVNPAVNQFQVLGVPTGVTDKQVAEAFQTSKEETFFGRTTNLFIGSIIVGYTVSTSSGYFPFH